MKHECKSWHLSSSEKRATKQSGKIITLTKPEINHLLGLIEDNERRGEYTAPLEQYWLRSDRIKSKLRESA